MLYEAEIRLSLPPVFIFRNVSPRDYSLARLHLGSCCSAVSNWVSSRLSRSCVVSERLNLRPQLLLNANKISYRSCRMVPFSMILSDPSATFQGFNDRRNGAASLLELSFLLAVA